MEIFKKKKQDRRGEMIVQAGVNQVFSVLLPFKAKEVMASFLVTDEPQFPACHPVPTDQIFAEISEFCGGKFHAITITISCSGTRQIAWDARNYFAR